MTLEDNGMVDGFFAGCISFEALLRSTLDCLSHIQCIQLLIQFFPNLNQVSLLFYHSSFHLFLKININWNETILSPPKSNISVNNHLLNLFLEEWSIETNHTLYYKECAPSSCTYRTIAQVNFVYAITLLISLYGGLVLIYRLIAPSLVNITFKIKRDSRNIRLNLGKFISFEMFVL